MRSRRVSGSLRHTKKTAISPNAICNTKCERQPNALCKAPPIIGAPTGASAMMAPISESSRPARPGIEVAHDRARQHDRAGGAERLDGTRGEQEFDVRRERAGSRGDTI